MISSVLQKMIFCATGKESVSELSDQEIAAVKEVWMRARQMDVGSNILSELIDKKPSFAVYYGFERSQPTEELRKSQAFILQAKRIQDFLETAVSSLGLSPDSIIHNHSYRIGQIHYYKGVNFGADNWLVFKKVTIEQVNALQKKSSLFGSASFKDLKAAEQRLDYPPNGNQRRCQAIVGWNKLMSMIIREMKRGFLEEARRNCGDDTDEFR
ncbi:hypothetical protein Q1695_007573 [Nippostrongylus brasiliensis]|nr:hypothetical protein Q1695_007573 [Nippostrongylus brasiliensis]